MTSTGVNIGNSPEEVAARMPGDKEMRIITPEEAKRLFGVGANRVEGATVRSFSLCSRTVLSFFVSGWPMTLLNCTLLNSIFPTTLTVH